MIKMSSALKNQDPLQVSPGELRTSTKIILEELERRGSMGFGQIARLKGRVEEATNRKGGIIALFSALSELVDKNLVREDGELPKTVYSLKNSLRSTGEATAKHIKK